MVADPDEPLLVLEQVDVVVAGPHRAELRGRQLLELADTGRAPGLGVVEQRMLDPLGILAADPERDHARDVVDDRPDAVGDRRPLDVEPRRHVAAGDVEADAGDRDVLRIGHDPADRLRVAEVAVGAQHRSRRRAYRGTTRKLRDRARVVLAEDAGGRHLRYVAIPEADFSGRTYEQRNCHCGPARAWLRSTWRRRQKRDPHPPTSILPLPTPPHPPIKGMLTIEDSGFAAFGHPACLPSSGPSRRSGPKGRFRQAARSAPRSRSAKMRPADGGRPRTLKPTVMDDRTRAPGPRAAARGIVS